MYILCLGLNHTTASLDLREKLALDENTVRIALARLACGHMDTPLTELILLSTCNRVELYAASTQLAFAAVMFDTPFQWTKQVGSDLAEQK